MISANSRYAPSAVVVGNNLDGTDINVIVPSQQVAYSFNYLYHQINSEDTLSLMAQDFYGDPTLWWVIADANPEVMLWDQLTVGAFIRVPTVAGGPIS